MADKRYEDLKNALKIEVMTETQLCHRERVVSVVRRMQAAEKKEKRDRIGFFEFVLRQLPFMGKDLWITQWGAAVFVSVILYLTAAGNIEGFSIRYIPLFLGIAAIVMVMASVPLLLRPYRYRMNEIEQVSFTSLPKLFLAELLILSVEYLAVLIFGVSVSAGMTGLSAVWAVFYFLLPLSAAGTGCIQIMRRTREWEETSHRLGMCEGYCVCLGTGFVVLYSMRETAYGSSELWGPLTVCMFLLFSLSVWTWVKESAEKGEEYGTGNL